MAKVPKEVRDLNRKLRNYLFLNVALVVSGLLLLDVLGLINLQRAVYPVLRGVPGLGAAVPRNLDDPFLLSREERKKEKYTLQMLEEKLKKKEGELARKEQELKTESDKLVLLKDEIEMMRKDYAEQKKKDSDYKKNIALQASYIESMRPEDAVDRLAEMDDFTVIDIFREMERRATQEGNVSLVSRLLTLFPPARASTIQRKMLYAEGE